MRVRLEYGRTGIDVELPDRHVVKCLSYQPMRPLPHPQEAVRQRLREPSGTPPLAELARGRRDACVVISDVTRPVPYRMLLPPPLAELNRQRNPRAKDSDPGGHRPAPAHHADGVGRVGWPEIVENYRIENHHGQELSQHTYLGQSPRGVPVWIDSRYVKSDLKITTGLDRAAFHGRILRRAKLICPGLAALETVRVWHGPEFLEHPRRLQRLPRRQPGPRRKHGIARMAGCDFIVNVVIDEASGRSWPWWPATWKRRSSRGR